MKLIRSNNKIIAGVCAGIADYLGWDRTIFRIAFLLLSIISAAFPGTIVYIILWILMPSQKNHHISESAEQYKE